MKNNKTKYNLNHKIHEKYYVFIVVLKTKFWHNVKKIRFDWQYTDGCFPCGLAGKEYAYNVGELRSISGLGRSPGEGKGYPLQYSCVKNPMKSMGFQRAGHDWLTFI